MEFRKLIESDPALKTLLATKRVWDEGCYSKWKMVWSPLHQAAFFGHLSLIKTLVEEHCVHLDIKHTFGGWAGTPLHAAINRNKPDAVRLLLSLGADTKADGTHINGNPFDSALHYAELLGGRADVVIEILKHGQGANRKSSLARFKIY